MRAFIIKRHRHCEGRSDAAIQELNVESLQLLTGLEKIFQSPVVALGLPHRFAPRNDDCPVFLMSTLGMSY
jgi:hypothetical protein